MSKKKLTLLVICLALAAGLLLTACSPDINSGNNSNNNIEQTEAPTEAPEATSEPEVTEEPQPITLVFTDGLGRTIELEEPASAIVTLGPSSLESLFVIGAGDQVVGREEYSTYPEEALAVTSVGSLWGELPSEAIVALEPDLVIAAEIISEEQVAALEDLGLTVFWQANPKDFDGLYANLRELAEMTGHQAEAEELITSLSDRVAAVEAVISTVKDFPTVFYELDATDPLNPYTIGAGTFIDTLITFSGGTNIGAVLEGEYAMISSEEVIVQNPDIILLGDAPYGITPESVAERPGWDIISAVQNDQVFPFDPFLVSVPGPRLVDGLEAMAKLFHPDLFE